MSSDLNINPEMPTIDHSSMSENGIVIDRHNGKNIEVTEETVAQIQKIGIENGKTLDEVLKHIQNHLPLIASVEAVHKMISNWETGETSPPLTDCVWGYELLDVVLEGTNEESYNEWVKMHIKEATVLRNQFSEMVDMYSSTSKLN